MYDSISGLRGLSWVNSHMGSRRGDVRLPSGPRDDSLAGKALTQREREICAMIACGHRNKEIAERLGMAVNTVKFRLHAIFEKRGVTNRTELALDWQRFLQAETE
jgi:DNA-binding NarL/FixJ family response regulator